MNTQRSVAFLGTVVACAALGGPSAALTSIPGASGEPHDRGGMSNWDVSNNKVVFENTTSASSQWDLFIPSPVSNFTTTDIHPYQRLYSFGGTCESRAVTFTSSGSLYDWGSWTSSEDLGTVTVPVKGSAAVHTRAVNQPGYAYSCELYNVYF